MRNRKLMFHQSSGIALLLSTRTEKKKGMAFLQGKVLLKKEKVCFLIVFVLLIAFLSTPGTFFVIGSLNAVEIPVMGEGRSC